MDQKEKGDKNMGEKVFHPTIKDSRVQKLDPKQLELCARHLHDLGWLTQQGMFDRAVERLRWWVEKYPEDFVTSCANGLTLILDALPQSEPEQPACTSHTLHFLP